MPQWLKNQRQFKGLLVSLAALLFFIPSTIVAQTTLAAGDVAIIAVNAANPDMFSIVLLKNITTNTVINFTDNGFTGTSATGRTGEGFLTYTAPTNLTAGTVLTWTNGMTITSTGWSSAAPTNFSFNGSGDQLFVFQGATANWATQSGITLLSGVNYGVALSATSSASNTLQPSSTLLPATSFLNLPTSTFANTYFANASTSATTVSVSGSASSLLSLFTDPLKWYGNAAAAATFPSYSITVISSSISTSGTVSPLSTTYGTASSETSFSVSGIGMTAGILVTPPAGFEVSLTSGGAFTPTVLVGAAGTISSTTVYLRLSASAAAASYTGNIVLSSQGAAAVNVALGTHTVSKKIVTISGVSANDKNYDGNTSATLIGTPILNGVVAIDINNVAIGGTPIANFATASAGNGIAVTVTGYILTGSAAGNYTLQQPSGLTANIIPTALLNQTITFNALPALTYGDAAVTLSASASSGLPITYTSSNTNVVSISGNVLTVIAPGTSTITASQAGNTTYSAATNTLQTQLINPKQLTVSGSIALSKVYDGTVNATVFGSSLSGIVGSDIVTISTTGIFATANVGVGIAVTSTQVLGGVDSAKYSVSLPTGLVADITAAPQTITFNPLPVKSTLDAPFTLTATASSGLSVSYTSSDTSVAKITGNTVTIIGAGSTTITASQSGNSNIAAAVNVSQLLTVNAALMAGDVAVIGYNTSGIPDNIALLILRDLQEGTTFYVNDNEVATAGATSFTDLAEGEASFTVNAGQTIPAGTVVVLPWGAAAVSNALYTWSSTSSFGLGNNNDEIYVYTAPSITSLTPTTFLYMAKIGSSLSAIPNGLTAGLTSIAPNGTALRYATSGATYIGCKPLLLSAIGSIASNWNTTGAATIAETDWAFTVLPTCPSISGTVNSTTLTTVYGTASAEKICTVSGTGLLAGITVTPPTGYEVSLTSGGIFTQSVTAGSAGNVTNIPVYMRLSAAAIPGVYAGNVVLSSLGVTNLNVTNSADTVKQKPLTISGITANNKIFDGNTTATISGVPLLSGLLPSDVSNVVVGGSPIANFSNASVGTAIPVTVTGYTLSGTAAAYYTIMPTTLSADILPTPLQNQSIVFNALSTAVYGDAPIVLTATASSGLPISFSSSNTNIVSVTGNTITILAPGTVSITASQAGNTNYNPALNVIQPFVVNPKMLSITGATVANKLYDGNTNATITGSILNGIVGSDTVLVNGTGNFATSNVGTGIAVTSTQTLSGPNANRYTLTLPSGLSADITQASQTITFTALTPKNTADLPFTLNATSTSGLPITYTSSNTAVATVVGNTVTIVGAGTTIITASQAGNSNYIAAANVTQSLTVTASAGINEIILPQYIQGLNVTNSNRIPYACLLNIHDLLPSTTYRYFVGAVIAADLATSNGAGNPIFVSPLGFTKSSSASLATAGGYATLTTDASGSYTGWFAIEPTGNATRFIPGNDIFIRLNLNDGANGTAVVTRLTTPHSSKVLNLTASAGVNNGTGLRGLSAASDKNFVVLYDNVSGNGRPLAASFVENDGSANVTSYASFYATSVEGVSGAYGVIIPNTNANGVRRIEQRNITTGLLVGCAATDADGIWPSGANTINPTGGTTALVITQADANLGSCCTATSSVSNVTVCSNNLPYTWNTQTINTAGSYTYTMMNAGGCDSVLTLNLTVNVCQNILDVKCYIQGYWDPSSMMMLPVLANQGMASAANACDSIDVELRSASTLALIQQTRVLLHQDGTAHCVFQNLNGNYYVVVKHRNAIETWSALPIAIGPTPATYNFTTAASKAYGNNQADLLGDGTIWGFYSGDIAVDENIDLIDLGALENDISVFAFGYMATDMNGDGNVDLLDSPIIELNVSNFIFASHP